MLETWALHISLTVLYNRSTHMQFRFVISSCHRKGLELMCPPCTLALQAEEVDPEFAAALASTEEAFNSVGSVPAATEPGAATERRRGRGSRGGRAVGDRGRGRGRGRGKKAAAATSSGDEADAVAEAAALVGASGGGGGDGIQWRGSRVAAAAARRKLAPISLDSSEEEGGAEGRAKGGGEGGRGDSSGSEYEGEAAAAQGCSSDGDDGNASD